MRWLLYYFCVICISSIWGMKEREYGPDRITYEQLNNLLDRCSNEEDESGEIDENSLKTSFYVPGELFQDELKPRANYAVLHPGDSHKVRCVIEDLSYFIDQASLRSDCIHAKPMQRCRYKAAWFVCELKFQQKK